jgi:peptide/nickel transport system substrate-binding protein
MTLGKKNGQKVKIEILPKASWGDGVPLTCEDVRATWLIGKDDNVSAPQRQEFLNIESIEVDANNPKKCEITFKEAKWNFYLNFPKPIPAHLELKIFNANKGKAQGYERNSLYVREPNNPGLYNGPFVVSELKLGSHVVLQPNLHFAGEPAKLKKVIFKFILNSAALESHLLAGDVNMISSSGLTFDQALVFEKKIAEQKLPFQVRFVDGTVYAHVDFNLDNPMLADLKVRKAMAFAVNKQEIVKAFFENRQRPALHFSTYLDSWYTDKKGDVELYPYDKIKANKLLDEAGWKLGNDGIRSRDGKRMTLTLVGAADVKLYEVLQTYLQSTWRKVGIEVNIKKFPARILFSEILRQRKFDLGMYSWVSSPDGTQRSVLHSDSIPSLANSWSGSNRPGWKNAKVDKWLEQVELEFNPKKRVQIMHKVLRAYTEDLPALPLFYRSNNSVVPANIKNYDPSGHVFSEYLNIEKWQLL